MDSRICATLMAILLSVNSQKVGDAIFSSLGGVASPVIYETVAMRVDIADCIARQGLTALSYRLGHFHGFHGFIGIFMLCLAGHTT